VARLPRPRQERQAWGDRRALARGRLAVGGPAAVSPGVRQTRERRRDDVALAHDVLDRQVVEADGVQILRPADLYLAAAGDRIELAGIEVGIDAPICHAGWRRFSASSPSSAQG